MKPSIPKPEVPISLVGQKISHIQFLSLAGTLAGIPFVKIVVDRENNNQIHFLHHETYPLHAYYVCDHILKEPQNEFLKHIDAFNESVYQNPNRRFYFGLIQWIHHQGKHYYALETVEVDNMDAAMMKDFYQIVKSNIDSRYPLLFKTANHGQEKEINEISPQELPRVFPFELYENANYISLNPGKTKGRIRVFLSELAYQTSKNTIQPYDIVVMHRVPDDIPRISGIINAQLTTPLSHTNVLAAGWGAPNCVQLNIFEVIQSKNLDGKWVEYEIDNHAQEAQLKEIPEPPESEKIPNWELQKVTIEKPDYTTHYILSLEDVRMTDAYRFGTKAANVGEIKNMLKNPSSKMLGFYRVPRPPRENLLPHLAQFLNYKPKAGESLEVATETSLRKLFEESVRVPRGLAIPFSFQQEFLQSSPVIQQLIGKLKMALELQAPSIDSLCMELQKTIRSTRIPNHLQNAIEQAIAQELPGATLFVLRSSSNAEDLQGFSAAGIYESVNGLSTREEIFNGIKQVWASLISPRSVRLRQEANISLDDSFMGVILQEQVRSDLGGVMITKNPLVKTDFRNVYINVSLKSVIDVVQGTDLPMQYLYNCVEGGGNTLSLGSAKEDLPQSRLQQLQVLALLGKFMQGHFSPDFTYSQPMDVEWIIHGNMIYLLQVRPFAK